MSEKIPTVIGLFVKPGSGVSMKVPMDTMLRFKAGFGIVNDSNASPISPRQVLITCQEDSNEFGINSGDLHENITISGLKTNEFKPGSILYIGDSVQIKLTFYCEPCKRINHLVDSLKDIVKKRGILGVVLEGGIVRIGDNVKVGPNRFLALSDSPYHRFLHYIFHVPSGRVVTYRHVVKGIGVADGYFRAIPGYIKRTSDAKYPLHRIVDTQGHLIPNYVPNQAIKLKEEGVEILEKLDLFGNSLDAYVNIDTFEWTDETFYLR